jgi:type VI secretion system protein ImpA
MDEQNSSDWQTQILAPFAGDAPAGEDLRLDATPQSIYYRLRDARAAARAQERASENDPAAGDTEFGHWRTVRQLSIEALQSRTKDIEIAAWLTESLTRQEGLVGLAAGAAILKGLIEQCWDAGLYPSADETEPEARLLAISGLSGADRDGSLLPPLRRVVLFLRDDGTPVTFWMYERSKDIAVLQASGQTPKGPAGNVPGFADLEAAAQGRGREALLAVGRGAAQALMAWQELEGAIAKVVPPDQSPSTSRLRGLLETIRRTVERYIPSSEFADRAQNKTEPESANTGSSEKESSTTIVVVPRSVAGRDTMLDQVLQIAETFRRDEPNSPFGYTLEEAVRRARLPWPDLLREMLPDPAPRSSILVGFGLKAQAD